MRVFSGADPLGPYTQFLAYASGMSGGVRVGAVDADADGRADILTVPGKDFPTHVKAFEGENAKGTVKVSILAKVGKLTKVVGVITFVYVASTDSVAVAAEGATRDALWPFIDIGAEAGNTVGGCTNEWFRSGDLNRQRRGRITLDILEDPNTEIPDYRNLYRRQSSAGAR